MSEEGAIKMVASKPDSVLAEEIRRDLEPLLKRAMEIMADARAKGLTVSFNISNDSFGRFVSSVSVVRAL
jgi:hypothetical protein